MTWSLQKWQKWQSVFFFFDHILSPSFFHAQALLLLDSEARQRHSHLGDIAAANFVLVFLKQQRLFFTIFAEAFDWSP